MCQITKVQGSLELASKNFITGATKIVYAIIYSLILVSIVCIDDVPANLTRSVTTGVQSNSGIRSCILDATHFPYTEG